MKWVRRQANWILESRTHLVYFYDIYYNEKDKRFSSTAFRTFKKLGVILLHGSQCKFSWENIWEMICKHKKRMFLLLPSLSLSLRGRLRSAFPTLIFISFAACSLLFLTSLPRLCIYSDSLSPLSIFLVAKKRGYFNFVLMEMNYFAPLSFA